MYQYFLGYDYYQLKHSFSYVSRAALASYLKRNNISYTFNINDNFREAIVPSGIDYFSFYAALQKKKDIKVNVIANSNMSDFQFKRTKKGPQLTLSLDAINYYRKADCLLTTFPSQEELIHKNGISTKIARLPILANDLTSSLSQNQKDVFLRHYRLQGNREIIISYGIVTSKDTIMEIRAIARNTPEKDFLFFGEIAKEALRQTLFESITQPGNLHFFRSLPEELYPSFLYHTSRLLLVGDYLCFPQIMIDCIFHNIPIITYKMSGFEEILNENDTCVTKLYSSLYEAIYKPINQEKILNAKKTLEKFQALNTSTEKTTIL